jgi:hypothetical protein
MAMSYGISGKIAMIFVKTKRRPPGWAPFSLGDIGFLRAFPARKKPRKAVVLLKSSYKKRFPGKKFPSMELF